MKWRRLLHGSHWLVFSCFWASLASANYVNSLDDFRLHTEAHIQRVQALGLYLVDSRPKLFRGVDRVLLAEYLSLHDNAKINTSPEFVKKYNLDQANPILKKMYKYFGKSIDQAPPDIRQRMSQLFHNMNQIDRNVRYEFFQKHGMFGPDAKLNELAQVFLKIENIADVVDRGENSVAKEEFHKKMQRASEMFAKKRPLDALLARDLENKYLKITHQYSFENWKRRRLEAKGCETPFERLN